MNAAPSLDAGSAESTLDNLGLKQKPDLVGSLKEKFGSGPAGAITPKEVENQTEKIAANLKVKPKDDYEKFMLEMGDILGPSSA